MFDFRDKVVLVTGASGIGIGKYIASHFFEAGAKLAICSRSKERIELAKEEITSSGGADRVFTAVCDTGDVEQIKNLFRDVIAHYGRIDILVNNAGVQRPKPSLDVTLADWDAQINTNLRGYFFCAQQAAADMIRRGEPGSIIMIGSVNATTVTVGQTAYAATKAGISQMTKNLAREWGSNGIRVNCVGPGSIPTLINKEIYADKAVHDAMCNKLPLRRRGDADEIADTTLFLASAYSSYITGQTIFADGGLTLVHG